MVKMGKIYFFYIIFKEVCLLLKSVRVMVENFLVLTIQEKMITRVRCIIIYDRKFFHNWLSFYSM